jgi:hypothetical protein
VARANLLRGPYPPVLNGMEGKVEDGQGNLGDAATSRFPSSLIGLHEPISGLQLSDRFHRKAVR